MGFADNLRTLFREYTPYVYNYNRVLAAYRILLWATHVFSKTFDKSTCQDWFLLYPRIRLFERVLLILFW